MTKYNMTDFDGARAAGFAPFNDNAHLCVELDGTPLTITCRTPSGKLVTFAFVGDGHLEYECVDVDYANSPAPKLRNGDRDAPTFHMLGFTVGRRTFDTRNAEFDSTAPTTLATLLLSDRHYKTD